MYLGHPEPVIRLLHGLPGVLHGLVRIPGLPVRAQAYRMVEEGDGQGKAASQNAGHLLA